MVLVVLLPLTQVAEEEVVVTQVAADQEPQAL